MKLSPLLPAVLLLSASSVFGRLSPDNSALPVIPLWPPEVTDAAVKAKGPEHVRVTDAGEHVVSNIQQPSLTLVLPEPGRATGAGIVICPGGGHRELWMDHEGYTVSRWLADRGVAAFIVKYRLAREEGSTYRVDVESLADAQRALRLVRHRAAEWGVDPGRVGIAGFSAGGELAALAAAHGADGDSASSDPIARESSRVAFQALIYPGNAKSIQPVKGASPAFLVCGYDDAPQFSEELPRVYLRFKQAGVPAELHLYTGVGHGFGLRSSNALPAGHWIDRLYEWLGASGFLRASAG